MNEVYTLLLFIIVKLFTVGVYMVHQTNSYQLFTMLEKLKSKDKA